MMVTIPELSTSVQVPNDEDIFTPSPGDSNIMAIIPEISSSSSHPHDQLELSGDFVDNDSSAMLETPDGSDLNGRSTLSHVTPPRSKKCPKCARGIPEPVLNIHMSLCSIQAPISPPTPPPKLSTIPELSLKDRQRQLNKFEMLKLKPRCWRKLLRITLPKTFQREKLTERDSYLKGLLGMIHPVVSGKTSYWSRLQRNRSWQSQNQKPPRKQTRRILLVEGPRKSNIFCDK